MRKKKGEQKREQIRKAAYQCFRDSGYHDTTVAAVCKKAKSSKGSFYWHYDSKQEVFIDILESWAREIMDELYEQFEEAAQQDDYIRAITEALAREIHRGRVIIPLWLEFTLQGRYDEDIQKALAKFYRRARVAIAEILRPMLEGKVSEAELRGVAATIFGAYTGLLVQDLSDPRRADATEMVDKVMSALGWWFRQLSATEVDLSTLRPLGEAENRPVGRLDEGQRVQESEIQRLLNQHPEASAVVQELRALILSTTPSADERIIAGWKQIAFDHKGLFCFIKPLKAGVRLGFNHGASLDDPAGLLTGRGKHQRYVDLPLDAPFPAEDLKALLHAARELQ